MSDVVSYKQNRKIKAKAALRQMTELSEEMELYDDCSGRIGKPAGSRIASRPRGL